MEDVPASEENEPSCQRSPSPTKVKTEEKQRSKKNFEHHCKSKRSVKCKLKTFSFGKWQRGFSKEKAKKRTFSLNRVTCLSSNSLLSESSAENVSCICTGYRRTKTMATDYNVAIEGASGSSLLEAAHSSSSRNTVADCRSSSSLDTPVHGNLAEVQQAPLSPFALNEISLAELTVVLRDHLRISLAPNPLLSGYSELSLPYRTTNPDQRVYAVSMMASVHTQVDYVHHLIKDLLDITNCSFYWGKMDRYKAERQLDKKPEGTFLLRDSAQEEFLFSVSFRRYGRTLHARVEQLNHKFSFDSHDPNVFASSTVCGLVEHYKNPRCCMFFEPMLTIPVHRTYPFGLQHMCRAAISSRITYDNVNQLKLPRKVKLYLKEYHYKQKVRVRHLESEM